MNPVITVNHLSKKYRLGSNQAYYSLRDSITSIIKSPLNTFQGLIKNELGKNEFWALKDISFKVYKGEIVGIIGPNGAGKSTLLKILSRITAPTNGQVTFSGRIASLLEVGTGFHQELTGRENIFLNGAILGMSRKEITGKFKAIIKFAGTENFLDTPVKHYSTGMRLRLAFAIAAHLDPEILLVDEVLSVGDVEFQKKSLKKMDEITKEVGKTVIFVSHDLASINKLCHRCIWLDKGKIMAIGNTSKIISQYLSSQLNKNKELQVAKMTFDDKKDKDSKILKVLIKNHMGKITSDLDMAKPFYIEAVIRNDAEDTRMFLGIISDFHKKYLFQTQLGDGSNKKIKLKKGISKVKIKINPLLNEGVYSFKLSTVSGDRDIDVVSRMLYFDINNYSGLPFPSQSSNSSSSLVIHKTKWEVT